MINVRARGILVVIYCGCKCFIFVSFMVTFITIHNKKYYTFVIDGSCLTTGYYTLSYGNKEFNYILIW